VYDDIDKDLQVFTSLMASWPRLGPGWSCWASRHPCARQLG